MTRQDPRFLSEHYVGRCGPEPPLERSPASGIHGFHCEPEFFVFVPPGLPRSVILESRTSKITEAITMRGRIGDAAFPRCIDKSSSGTDTLSVLRRPWVSSLTNAAPEECHPEENCPGHGNAADWSASGASDAEFMAAHCTFLRFRRRGTVAINCAGMANSVMAALQVIWDAWHVACMFSKTSKISGPNGIQAFTHCSILGAGPGPPRGATQALATEPHRAKAATPAAP